MDGWIIVTIAASVTAVFLIIIGLVCYVQRQRQKEREKGYQLDEAQRTRARNALHALRMVKAASVPQPAPQAGLHCKRNTPSPPLTYSFCPTCFPNHPDAVHAPSIKPLSERMPCGHSATPIPPLSFQPLPNAPKQPIPQPSYTMMAAPYNSGHPAVPLRLVTASPQPCAPHGLPTSYHCSNTNCSVVAMPVTSYIV